MRCFRCPWFFLCLVGNPILDICSRWRSGGEVIEEAARISGLYCRALVDRVLSPQLLHLELLWQNLWVCPSCKHLLHWRGERTLGKTSKSALKIDGNFGILVDKNFISTMRVEVRLPSLCTAVVWKGGFWCLNPWSLNPWSLILDPWSLILPAARRVTCVTYISPPHLLILLALLAAPPPDPSRVWRIFTPTPWSTDHRVRPWRITLSYHVITNTLSYHYCYHIITLSLLLSYT